MARFIGFVQGQRGETHRLGHSSITARINGWHGGVDVYLYIKDDVDHARITITGGSSNRGRDIELYDGPITDAALINQRMGD